MTQVRYHFGFGFFENRFLWFFFNNVAKGAETFYKPRPSSLCDICDGAACLKCPPRPIPVPLPRPVPLPMPIDPVPIPGPIKRPVQPILLAEA